MIVKKIVAHDGDTVLLTVADGFDPVTGVAKPDKEVGYQRSDIDKMRADAEKQVEAAEAALDAANDNLALFGDLVDRVAAVPKVKTGK